MSESTYTPGPWHVEKCGVRNKGGYICEMTRPTSFDGQAERYEMESAMRDADARMIAAAPDMLDALKAFPGFTDDATVGDKWIEQMRAAIAKAEGKS